MDPTTPLPTGTVTFLFTDIEGSTRLLHQLGDRYTAVLADQRRLLRAAFSAHGGHELGTEGDSFFVAFSRAADALSAVVNAQRALATHPWLEGAPVRVRMALHTGEPIVTPEGYIGMDLHRAARISACGHGGQILLSRTTYDLVADALPVGVSLQDLGSHRLKDLLRPEQIFQVEIEGIRSDFAPLRSLDARPTNLPVQPTRLIGREKEMAAVRELLLGDQVRLVTLTGPGGTGKTRLALQVATELLDAFVDGVFFVDLAPIREPELVVSTVAHTLGVRETSGQSILESLKNYLRDKGLLLVLDNFEQVVDAASVVAELLGTAPKLKVLVTSRTVLGVRGEQQFPVPPLAVPDLRRLPPVESLSQYAAVELFIQRAVSVKPDFVVTNETAPAVAEICHRLDGLPLAIELAAARVKLFAPPALLARLENRLKLLTGGPRDVPTRQQTLRNAIGWSYDLLTQEERKLFQRLSLFVGGCTMEAAAAVCDGEGDLGIDMLDGISSLVEKSLLRQEAGPECEPRFGMLETIREFGLASLTTSGEQEEVRSIHAGYFLGLAEEAEPHLRAAERPVWMERLDREHDNLRAVLAWSQSHPDRVETGLQLAGALFWFWRVRCYWSEGKRWLSELLPLPEASRRTSARARALNAAGAMAWLQGEFETARSWLEESLAIARELEDRLTMASALSNLGITLRAQGASVQCAKTLHEESLTIGREIGDRWTIAYALLNLGNLSREESSNKPTQTLYHESLALFRDLGDRWGVAWPLWGLGKVAEQEGDYERAVAFYTESLILFEELAAQGPIAFTLGFLGTVAYARKDYKAARAYQVRSLAIWRDLGNVGPSVARSLKELGRVALAQGQPMEATRLLGLMQALGDTMRAELGPIDRTDEEQLVALARAALGEDAFATAWTAGRALTIEEVVAHALETVGDDAPQKTQ